MMERNHLHNEVQAPSPSGRVDDGEIDLLAVFRTLRDGRWAIAGVTLLFVLIGITYSLLKVPIYRANSLIQVEEKQGALPGMEELAGLLGSSSTATTEIELIKSRRVLGNAVDNLNLDIVITPVFFPLVGEAIARWFDGRSGEVSDPLIGSSFAWGGEKLSITRLKVPESMEGDEFTLEATTEGWRLLTEEGESILKGPVGQVVSSGPFEILVAELSARPGTQFRVVKLKKYNAILQLQENIHATEKGKDTGIISLSFEHEDPVLAREILNAVGRNYVRQNVERNSAEAAKSLEFLRNSLPDVKKELEEAERKLNSYQKTAESIDITAEAEALLEQVVELEKSISELEIQRAEIEQRFRPTHPRYKAWASQMVELKERRAELNNRIGALPETQQELVRLRRDVEVGNEIYLQLLSNIQQLDIARAGTVGNVRVVDDAAGNVEEPVKPKRVLIVGLSALLGCFAGVFLVLIKSFLKQGIESPEQLERKGIPVYASVPVSADEIKADRLFRSRHSPRKLPHSFGKPLLATSNPSDLSIESLRSLRTSLHFAMMEAGNRVLMITGPSPGSGKSFTAANLAAVLTQAEQRVVLVDGDMRKGHLHYYFGNQNEKGLSDILSGKLEPAEVVQQQVIPGLDLISNGRTPPNPSELLMHERFAELMESLCNTYDMVLIDTPPILAVTDAAVIGQRVGTALMVARYGVNSVKEVEFARERLAQNNVRIKGAIINCMEQRSRNEYGYYAYGYEYQRQGASD